jgi:hypothetical protein
MPEHTMNTELKARAQKACLAWLSDPGHAWLAVSLDDEIGLPSAIKFASSYSYLDITAHNFAGVVFLEEDADAREFMKAYEIDMALIPEQSTNEESPIRDLPRATN